jgi:hypothetical protein
MSADGARVEMTERDAARGSGVGMLIVGIVGMLAAIGLIVASALSLVDGPVSPGVVGIVGGVLLIIASVLVFCGLIIVPPNQARVLVLFGRYIGTVRQEGWHWVNPFTVASRPLVSLRIRNFDTTQIKVNDHAGNPVLIAAVVAWKVVDTARAVFDVQDYEKFVGFQAETAVRHVASQYPYDNYEEGGFSLTGNADEVCATLQAELEDRLSHAGVTIVETRLSHLSYSPEIAGAMLRRQQANAIVAARARMVEGAVGMVDMALKMIARENIVELDEERKAAMISNLLVVLTGEQAAHPVINAGSLYQ